ncbi:unnamed protein product [Schistocephalus solidus]|uniref:Uncharacterized protein n=1 Tax=Schistocephalus solidus TaxID=70667 RepID=A0A183SAY1_SCHSO|nr:unnamed protein product [Schistocephalus solidus]
MLADDVKLWRVIKSDSDNHAHQEGLNHLSSWSARWPLNFYVGKCVVVRLRTRRTSEEDDSYQYIFNEKPLSIVEEQKDLGVLIKSSLKPSSQCLKAAQRATQVLFALRCGYVPIGKELFQTTYGVLVRSPLAYAVQALRPWFKKDYLQLERVQARATKMVKNLSHMPNETRLVELHFFPLNYRQLRGDLIQTYRIVRGRKCALEFAEFFELVGTKHLRGSLSTRTSVRTPIRRGSLEHGTDSLRRWSFQKLLTHLNSN